MALTTGGGLYVWGDNLYGQVGDGTTTDRKTPVSVSLTNVVAITAGEFHSLALTSDGKVYAWGRNHLGQSGGAASSNVTTPTVVINGGVVAIAAGRNHSVAVKDDGTVWAWGSNNKGQLGNGSTSTTSNATPAQMLGVAGAIKAAAGEEHSLILLSSGTAMGVGENSTGQLGDASTTDKSTATTVVGLSNVSAMAAGLDQNFALRRTVRCGRGAMETKLDWAAAPQLRHPLRSPRWAALPPLMAVGITRCP